MDTDVLEYRNIRIKKNYDVTGITFAQHHPTHSPQSSPLPSPKNPFRGLDIAAL